MQARDIFFENYDNIMPLISPSYHEFLELASLAIPEDARSVLDLGVGTGNFSLKIKKRIPKIKIYGIDLEERLLKKARIKIPDAELYCGNILDGNFPKTDYIISSFTTHHFQTKIRSKELSKIAKSSTGFVNVDLVIPPGQTFDDLIKLCSDFSRKSFSEEDVRVIEREMRNNDNPIPLKELMDLFDKSEYDFEILGNKNFNLAYKVFNKSI